MIVTEEIALDGATPVTVEPGGRLVVSGLLTTSTDGCSFDGAATWCLAPDGRSPLPVPGGLFDWAAGGLRVVEQRPAEHLVFVSATGAAGAACVAAGVPAPCLVPRLSAIAHDRLLTKRELAATLSGHVEVRTAVAGPVATSAAYAAPVAACGGLAALALAAGVVRCKVQRPMSRVRAAARRLLRASRTQPAFSGLSDAVGALVGRAAAIDAASRVCVRAVRRAPPTSPSEAERAERERIEHASAAARLELDRIETALRVAALRAEARIDPGSPCETAHALEALQTELAIGEQALDEARDALAPGSSPSDGAAQGLPR